VVEVFTLEQYSRSTGKSRETMGFGDDGRAPGVGAVQFGKFGLKYRVGFCCRIGSVEFVKGRNE
jgi:hypothetical protein